MKINTKVSLYPIISIILVLYLVTINNMSNILLSSLLGILSFMLFNKPIYLLPPLFVAGLNENYFVFFQGISTGRVLTILYISASVIKIIRSNRRIMYSHVIILIFMITYTVISAMFSLTGSLTPALGMSLNFLIAFFMYYDSMHCPDKFIRLLSLGFAIYLVSVLGTIYTGEALYFSGRLIVDEAVNSNSIGMAFAQIGSFFFAMTITYKKKINRLLYATCFLLSVVFLFLTGSRSAFVGLIIGMIIIMLIKLHYENKISKRITTILTFSILSIGFYFIVSNMTADIFNQFSLSSIVESGGTGRSKIWYAVLYYIIPENLLFGVGFGGINVANAIFPYIYSLKGTHNMFLTILAQLGLFGLLVYTLIYAKILGVFIKQFKHNKLMIIPLTMILTAFGNGIGEDIFTERFLWISIGLGFMLNNYYKTIIENTQLDNKC